MNRGPIEAYSRTSQTPDQRKKLIEDYLPLVQHVLGRLPIHLPKSLDREDLFEVGVLGLINAADSYDPGRGAAFKTHAYTNIRGAILDELRRHDIVPRSRRDRLKHVGEVEARLERELDRPPTPEEIADAAGLTLEQVEDVLTHAHGAAVLSTEEPMGGGEDGAARLIDGLRMPGSPDPSDEAERRELKSALAQAIQELPDRERHVVLLYYAEGLLLKEIGAVMSITESRVSQLHARALHRLNRSLQAAPAKRP